MSSSSDLASYHSVTAFMARSGRPPHAHGVALGRGLERQEDVGEGHRRRRHVRVGHHAELHVLQHLVHARGGRGGAHVAVGALRPVHLHGIGLAGLERAVHRVAVGHADELHAAGMHQVNGQLLGERVGVAVQLRRGVARVDLEAVAHQQVRARLVDVAAHAHEVAHRLAQLDGVHLRVEGETPVDGAALGVGVEARRLGDELGRKAGDLAGPLRRELGHVVLQLVVVRAPVLDELLVLQLLGGDDVQPRQRHAKSVPGRRFSQ